MRLSKIKLAGFKSFVDPTLLDLRSNLVGVLGPNGCGKSNIIDAVRWVLGESSVKNLRGKSMDDVIFNGSSGRKPVGQASVELIFDNSDASLGGQWSSFSEISIKRIANRDSSSAYYLNNSRCRLKDIREVFQGTGLGHKSSYAIIGQGTISRFVEAKPDEMRAFIEESAGGISKYKLRRKETQAKIAHTEENLARLNDIVHEKEKILQKLARQAEAAREYTGLKEQEHKFRIELSTLKWFDYNKAIQADESHIRESEVKIESFNTNLNELEILLSELRDARKLKTSTHQESQQKFYSITADISAKEQEIKTHNLRVEDLNKQQADNQIAAKRFEDALESDLQDLGTLEKTIEELKATIQTLIEDRKSAKSQLEEQNKQYQLYQNSMLEAQKNLSQYQQETDIAKLKIDNLEKNIIKSKNRVERITEEIKSIDLPVLGEQATQKQLRLDVALGEVEDTQTKEKQLKLEIEDLQTQINELKQRLDDHKEKQLSISGQIKSLEALNASESTLDKTNADWLAQHNIDSNNVLSKHLRIEQGWEHALEVVMGKNLQAICVSSIQQIEIKNNDLLNLALISNQEKKLNHSDLKAASLFSKLIDPKYGCSWLQDVLVADTYSQAKALLPTLSAQQSVITKSGIWISHNWLRINTSNANNQGVIARNTILAELKPELEKLNTVIAEINTEYKEKLEYLKTNEIEYKSLYQKLNKAMSESATIRAQLQSLKEKQQTLSVRRGNLFHEKQQLFNEMQQYQAEIGTHRSVLSELIEKLAHVTQEKQQISEQEQLYKSQLKEKEAIFKSLNNDCHQSEIKLATGQEKIKALKQNIARSKTQRQHIDSQQKNLIRSIEKMQVPLTKLTENLNQLLQLKMQQEMKMNAAYEDLEQVDIKINTTESNLNSISHEKEALSSHLEKHKLSREKNSVYLSEEVKFINSMDTTHETVLETLSEDSNVPEWEKLLEKTTKRIQRLGSINLAAVEEFDAETEKKTYLDKQIQDLMEGIERLTQAIKEIDDETIATFKQTFDQANQHLKTFFPKLFGGGHAYLELNGDDLLDAGVTLMARPPGKKNTSIYLLSGGEKALTAIALVFSLFQLNPAPFCLLDEVDAPLDDTNVGRYCHLVQEMSQKIQFIYITHNKLAMEMAHQLSGVTMKEPGVSRLVSVDVNEAVEMV